MELPVLMMAGLMRRENLTSILKLQSAALACPNR
jgi:hypothetical protein